MDTVMMRIDNGNYGMFSSYRLNPRSSWTLLENKISFTNKMDVSDDIIQEGKVIGQIHYRYAQHKRNGMYKMLKPKIEWFA